MREGFTYEEIANEEGVTITRIRQIVSQELRQRSVDSGAEHAKLQLERPASVIQLAPKAVAACDATAITPYLKVLDWLDRYQTVASANEVYDEKARKKLMDKTNRMAANFGVDEVIAAAVQEHLKKIGEIPNDEPTEADGDEARETTPADVTAERMAPIRRIRGMRRSPDFLFESLITH